MSKILLKNRIRRQRQGAMLILICVMIFAFLATVAFSVDIAYMHLVRAELRSATDAAAKATAQKLAKTQDISQAITEGKAIAAENQVAGQPLQLRDADILFGNSRQDSTKKFIFAEGSTPTNSVHVIGDRTGTSLSGSVGLFFGRALGRARFEPREVATATFLERDVVLVVDRSGSMLEPSTSGSKFDELKRAVASFVTVLQSNPTEESVGLASYASTASQDSQLSKDLNLVNTAMSRMVASGATSISRGIAAGHQIMRNGRSGDFVERTMIVMTDGLHNTGRSPTIDAQNVANDRITIHTVTFGSGADQRGMQRIATIGGGKHFHANSGPQLEAAFREIANTLSTIVTE